ncbi:hypothetical protein [Paraburkholderia gardini]|uniref:Lipoprotein n=1 Tax=Paraburkholderia gardini TaxID=2823469 RepID=A0ABN7QQU6_9BURK|nr:hypothetical protein [Paraburkholderia gardini]CAG4902543.1 hypothetical protein R69919_02956 [Paraburkholderia gardini]CAG4910645.1 hypothetical protein R54767_03715 [Paraburkholderia gardini]
MKPEHLKLAGIATLMCGAMSSFGAEAATGDPSALATGRILSLRNTLTDPTPGMTDDTVQDTEPVTQGDVPDVAPEADTGVAPAADVVTPSQTDAVSDVVYTARMAVRQSQSQDSGEASIAVPESAHLPYVPTVFSVPDASADERAPVASAVSDSLDSPDSRPMPVASTDDVAPVLNVVPADHVEPVSGVVPDVVRAQDGPVALADDAVPVKHVVPKPARVAKAPRTSVSVTVPVMSAVPGSAPVPDARDDSARRIVSTSDASSNIASNADAAIVLAQGTTRAVPDAVSPNVPHSNEAAPVTASSGEGLLERAAVSLKSTVNPAAQPASPHVTKHDDEDPAWASADVVAVDSDRLDSMRGGFDLPSGLVVSFGISRAAFVNGNLVASTSFNIPNIAQMTPQQAQMLANANTGALVQNGLNNTVQPGGLPALTGSVIQNSLNNQQVQALTTINTSVNSLAAFKAFNIGSTLNAALTSAVRPR